MKNISVDRKGTKTIVTYERRNKPVKIYYNDKLYAKVDINKKTKKSNFERKFTAGILIFFAMVIGGSFFFEDTTVVKEVEAKVIEPIVIEKIVKVKDDTIPPILKKIALAESMNSHYCTEKLVVKRLCKKSEVGQVLRGVKDRQDIGKFQISLKFHKEQAEKMNLDLFKESDNEKYALWLFNNQGSVPWSASALGKNGWINKIK